MQFNDTADENGLIQDITSKTKATLTDYTLKTRTRDINNAYSKLAYLIMMADGRMQFDDANHIDQPISEANLVNGQEDYNVFLATPPALEDWLRIDRVEAKNADGLGITLRPIDKRNIKQAWTEFNKTDGQPVWYDFNGSSVLLKPNPNYDSVKGLKIYFKRAPSYFSSSDTTKRPGFATIFHEYLSLWASYHYARDHTLRNAGALKQDLKEMEIEIGKYYADRAGYEPQVLRRGGRSYK